MGEVPTNGSHPFGDSQNFTCTHCGTVNAIEVSRPIPSKRIQSRQRANHYPQYTRKFSLGNGPDKWIKEYLINRQSGKMLGTLVALAVARMPNLESFLWDIPTGVLRDCWLALSTVGQHQGQGGKLENIWIRFHDNKKIIQSNFIQTKLKDGYVNGRRVSERIAWSYSHIEHPSFSILPPIRSLNVLAIDEIAYIEEMSVLIQRSKGTLRELRMGMNSYVPTEDFASMSLKSFRSSLSTATDPSSTYKGALDLLLSRSDSTTPASQVVSGLQPPESLSTSVKELSEPDQTKNGPKSHCSSKLDPAGIFGSLTNVSSSLDGENSLADPPSSRLGFHSTPAKDHGWTDKLTSSVANQHPSRKDEDTAQRSRLRLEILELEYVNLSLSALSRYIDWSVLTTLTLLHCDSHEQLWSAFRRRFAPIKSVSSLAGRKNASPGSKPRSASDYRLTLKRLHTNTVCRALISFLKETLAPNSLEWLFLQDGGMVSLDPNFTGHSYYSSSVTIEEIVKGPLRRHRRSLTKLSIDSSARPKSALKWKKWMLNRDALSYVLSGKMGALREVGMSIDRQHWHFFLQRLPQVPHIRSLYIPHIFNPHPHTDSPKEYALQILDIVALRPNVELCYLGIMDKCFEIMEGTFKDDTETYLYHTAAVSAQHDLDTANTDSDFDDEDEDEMSDDSGLEPGQPGQPASQAQGLDSEDEDVDVEDDASDDEDLGERDREPRLKLREILFHDDKVSIFKARHAKL
ncbi:MAG: hypothetical protein Q9183_004219 [Haloplaca sp. 2 TL-2023]